jgi:hypothetical protein
VPAAITRRLANPACGPLTTLPFRESRCDIQPQLFRNRFRISLRLLFGCRKELLRSIDTGYRGRSSLSSGSEPRRKVYLIFNGAFQNRFGRPDTRYRALIVPFPLTADTPSRYLPVGADNQHHDTDCTSQYKQSRPRCSVDVLRQRDQLRRDTFRSGWCLSSCFARIRSSACADWIVAPGFNGRRSAPGDQLLLTDARPRSLLSATRISSSPIASRCQLSFAMKPGTPVPVTRFNLCRV